jgi:hypothetical protein
MPLETFNNLKEVLRRSITLAQLSTFGNIA